LFSDVTLLTTILRKYCTQFIITKVITKLSLCKKRGRAHGHHYVVITKLRGNRAHGHQISKKIKNCVKKKFFKWKENKHQRKEDKFFRLYDKLRLYPMVHSKLIIL